MNISVNQLGAFRYELFEELVHARLVEFVRANSKPDSMVSISYWLFNGLIAGYIVFLLFRQDYPSVFEVFSQLGLGFFLFFVVLLPLHELIHGMAYKLLGARQVTFHAEWRQLTFFAAANHFVASSREFYVVALLPFLLINAGLIIVYLNAEPPVSWVLLGALLLHTAGCSGDFALVNFLYKHRDKQLVTYDDVTNGTSYFYAKQTGSNA